MSATLNGSDEDDEDKNLGPYTPMTGSMVDSLLPDEEGDDFEIVETDDNFQPVEQPATQQEPPPAKPAPQADAADDDAPRDTDDEETARKRRDRAIYPRPQRQPPDIV